MEKEKNKQYYEIWPIYFQTDDPINSHLDNTGKILAALQPTSSLNSILYPISEGNS